MGGWYAMIMDAGSDSASSATRVVKLLDSGGQRGHGEPGSRGLTRSSARFYGSHAAAAAADKEPLLEHSVSPQRELLMVNATT